uniref:Lipid/polyisoprenoid-binding YceI-like domain-containing protein n=1 Tax=Trypanosoma congolense (strain IL3000) TaxID=1068625 RepID=G0URV0_TRYCI|nr:conserved hypothetical protein [Trypanosoma congolense IL3000]
MIGWRRGERRISSASSEMEGVDMFVYTLPTGLLGRVVGRALRFRVERFAFTVNSASTSSSSGKGCSLKSVDVDADSLAALCEVDRLGLERVPLTLSEVMRVERRTREYVLDSAHYPRIVYTVERETPHEIKGMLELHGERKPVVCTKTVEGPELVVRCPIDTRQFNIPSYGLLLGVLSVSPHVRVETRVPLKVLQRSS